VDEGWVLYTARQTSSSNSDFDLDLFGRRPATGQLEQLTADDQDTELLAAGEGDVLYRSYSQPTTSQLYFRSKSQVVPLGADFGAMGGFHSMYASRPARLISQGAVVWRGAAAINLFDGVSSQVIASIPSSASVELDHQAGSVAWSAWDGNDLEMYLYRNGAVTQLTQNQVADRDPQLWGSGVLWMCGESVCQWEAGTTRELDSGKCTDLVAGPGRAAWVCDGQVMIFDGKALRAVTGSRGDKMTRAGLHLDGDRLLWLEVEPDADMYHGRGKVYFWGGEQPMLVAEVGLPCLYCDAFWPPLELALSGELAAWSYHLDGQPLAYPRNRCAYTSIRRQLDCGR
jgi:hypothetical protein